MSIKSCNKHSYCVVLFEDEKCPVCIDLDRVYNEKKELERVIDKLREGGGGK